MKKHKKQVNRQKIRLQETLTDGIKLVSATSVYESGKPGVTGRSFGHIDDFGIFLPHSYSDLSDAGYFNVVNGYYNSVSNLLDVFCFFENEQEA